MVAVPISNIVSKISCRLFATADFSLGMIPLNNMPKHDTWIKLKSRCPYFYVIEQHFPEGIPMRDPFSMTRTPDGGTPLWIVDMERLTPTQYNELAIAISNRHDATTQEVVAEADNNGGFAISEEWIASMQCGAEGMHRTKELADWLETAPPANTVEGRQAFSAFQQSQYQRWIEGNEVPPPLPRKLEDFDPRLITPELEDELKREKIAQMMGGYSVLDMLMGKGITEILNAIDPNNEYELFGEDKDDLPY